VRRQCFGECVLTTDNIDEKETVAAVCAERWASMPAGLHLGLLLGCLTDTTPLSPSGTGNYVGHQLLYSCYEENHENSLDSTRRTQLLRQRLEQSREARSRTTGVP
jgi:hypothetical protein